MFICIIICLYQCGLMNTYFILWFIIQYYYLFGPQIALVSHWELFRAGFSGFVTGFPITSYLLPPSLSSSVSLTLPSFHLSFLPSFLLCLLSYFIYSLLYPLYSRFICIFPAPGLRFSHFHGTLVSFIGE